MRLVGIGRAQVDSGTKIGLVSPTKVAVLCVKVSAGHEAVARRNPDIHTEVYFREVQPRKCMG